MAKGNSTDKILLVYKKSLYQLYFLDRSKSNRRNDPEYSKAYVTRLKKAHDYHLKTMDRVKRELTDMGIPFKPIYRARHVDYSPFQIVISVGGDGTFLEAARNIKSQLILGVNSDPDRSVGAYCTATASSFKTEFNRILSGKASVTKLNRMDLTLDGITQDFFACNDVMIAHHSAAAMSQYTLQIGKKKEKQRGSGLWLATASGSTGGIWSAGAKPLALRSKKLLYQPRELYKGGGATYALPGGAVDEGTTVRVESLMREGTLFIDGAHFRLPFGTGSKLKVCNAKYPLQVIGKLKRD